MLPYTPVLSNKALTWAINHVRVTQDEVDEYGYVYRASITINKPYMIREIRDYIRKNTEYPTTAQDSKRGFTYGIKVLEDVPEGNERECFISVTPANVITYYFTSAVKPE